ncbi:conserved exported hypothetical protein [Candidatus Sulfopaludibacter sp. SbA3]|nr:conserved exported hypothetical protein [Candidatus Sulfopaludibacter sp. SbA3]
MKSFTRNRGARWMVLLALAALSAGVAFHAAAQQTMAVSAEALSARKFKGSGFPDFGFMVTPAEYSEKYSDQPVFRLKADFPHDLPAHLPEFIDRIDFRKDPRAYLLAVRDYAFEGNLPDWDPFKNTVRQWYHIPWLHPTTTGPNAYPPNGGTEGFRGLIKEAPITPLQLAPGQKGKDGNYSVYAVTLVNEFAGYTMGKMWADPEHPDPRATDARYGGGFPKGTVFAKLLFTDAPQGTDKIPFLVNPLQWKAYITQNFWTSSTRVVTPVNLLQMDLAVRDPRADAPGLTGWVFGTFVYNGQLNQPNKFMNLVPLGLMWGNDPDDRTNTTDPFPPTKTKVNPKLTQTVIFDDAQLPPQHLGWNGRLNGPADLNTTSCLSCHIAAQYPAVTSLVPVGAVPDGGPKPPAQGGTDEWMKWFQNLRCATSMDPRTYSTDFSFQVAIALQNFATVHGMELQGTWATDYSLPRKPIARGRLKK